jgi:ADP-ribose pyrophosphatase
MLRKLRKISSVLKFSNPWWDYRVDEYIRPDGKSGVYNYVDSRGSTMVIPVNEDGKIILIRQYRYLNSRESIEFPGGGIKKKLSPLENAIEELKEETGYGSRELTYLGCFNPFNGVTNEMCSVYLAKDLVAGDAKPEHSEEFEIIELNKEQIDDKINNGEIWDGMTIAAWALLRLKDTLK